MKWFDEQGYLVGELPQDCVDQCSHSGQCVDDVRFWLKELDFQVPRDKAIVYLRGFGAWDDLEDMTDEDLAEKVLWIACGNIHDQGEWLGLID